jgi:hypothetical protein
MQAEGSTSSLRHLEVSMSHPVSPDVHRLVADAIAAIRSGDKARGQKLLMQALRINPHHEVAWLWMASLVETPERRRECLERALAINPNNETARRALQALSEPQPSHATPQQHIGAPDQTFHSSPTSVHEHVQTATQANRTQDDQARHCPHCGAPLKTTASFCAFCKSSLALPSASDAPSPPKRASLTDKERKLLEACRNTQRRRKTYPFSGILAIVPFFLILTIAGVLIVPQTLKIKENLTIDDLGWLWCLSAVMLPLLLISVAGSYFDHRLEKLLKKATFRVECPILDVWKKDKDYDDERYDNDKSSSSPSFFVAWELTATDQDGQPLYLQQAQEIDNDLYDCLKMRRTVRVRYAPEQPDVSILDEEWVAAIQKSSHV